MIGLALRILVIILFLADAKPCRRALCGHGIDRGRDGVRDAARVRRAA